jgi:Glycosyltransferase family 87
VSEGRKHRHADAGASRQSAERIFTEPYLRFWGSGVVIVCSIDLVWRLFRHQWFFGSDGKRGCIDFSWMWVSGVVAGSSHPAQVYDGSAWSVAWKILTGLDDCRFAAAQGLGYPPTYLFFTYPLGLVPYGIAFPVWMAATLLLYVAAVYAIIPRPATVIAALTSYPVIVNALEGQNGFLTAGLTGLSLVFMERRPWLSGVFLGLLTCKPQLGILFPFALLAARKWRALASATTTSVVLGVAAAIAFGYQAWPSFIHSLVGRDPNLMFLVGRDADLMEKPWGLVSIFGFLETAGVGTRLSWAVHLAVAGVIAAAVCAVWAKPIPHSLKAAILCLASMTVTPYVHLYDLCILSIAVAFFVRDGLSRGFLRGERVTMLICWFGLFFLGPFPAIVCAVLLILAFRRALQLPGDAVAPPRPVLLAQSPQP